MTPAELPITGYLDRLSARPGENIVAHISVAAGTRYRARLQRVICADPHPNGPGRRYQDFSSLFDRTFDGRRQPIALGSYARVAPAPARSARAPRTWTALVWTGLPMRDQAVIADEGEATHAVLSTGPKGAMLTLSSEGGSATIACGTPLQFRTWYRIWASADPDGGSIIVGQSRARRGRARHCPGKCQPCPARGRHCSDRGGKPQRAAAAFRRKD